MVEIIGLAMTGALVWLLVSVMAGESNAARRRIESIHKTT